MPEPAPPDQTPVPLDAGARALHNGSRLHLQLRLLGGFRLERDGQALRIPYSARRLVGYLGIHGRSDRSEVAGTLWPDVPESRARGNLRTALWRLHRITGSQVVIAEEVLATAPGLDVDVQTFVTAVRRILGAGPTAPDRASIPELTGVGELLPGWYEDWVLFERERLRQLQMHALETLAGRLTAAGRYAEAIDTALAAVRLEPLRESATRALIVAHLGEHNLVEAVRCYASFRDSLATELGVLPTPELERLVRSCLTRQA
jgi:DNA-binding SARP family transcriptional activator